MSSRRYVLAGRGEKIRRALAFTLVAVAAWVASAWHSKPDGLLATIEDADYVARNRETAPPDVAARVASRIGSVFALDARLDEIAHRLANTPGDEVGHDVRKASAEARRYLASRRELRRDSRFERVVRGLYALQSLRETPIEELMAPDRIATSDGVEVTRSPFAQYRLWIRFAFAESNRFLAAAAEMRELADKPMSRTAKQAVEEALKGVQRTARLARRLEHHDIDSRQIEAALRQALQAVDALARNADRDQARRALLAIRERASRTR